MKLILTILYGLLIVPARLALGAMRRDPLMLHDDGRSSYWIELGDPPRNEDYFSQGATRGGPHAAKGIAWLLLPVYRGLAKWYTPRRPKGSGQGQPVAHAAVRDQRIPDENYTLW